MLEAGKVRMFVVDVAAQDVFVMFKHTFNMNQCRPSRAIEKLVDGGNGQRFSHSIH
jgi:hypothetical protein